MASQVQIKKARLRVRGGVSVGVRKRERGD